MEGAKMQPNTLAEIPRYMGLDMCMKRPRSNTSSMEKVTVVSSYQSSIVKIPLFLLNDVGVKPSDTHMLIVITQLLVSIRMYCRSGLCYC